MAEIPKLDLESEENITVSDHINIKAFQYRAEKSDSYVIDMDAFSSTSSINKDNTTNANSRLKLQRSLSRKGSQRGGDSKVNGNSSTLHDKDTVPTITSPKGGCCTPEKPIVGSTTYHSVHHHHHQISISGGTTATSTTESSKCNIITRRNSFRRSYFSWALDPKRVLLFFATLSSIGTMLLIYFTLTMSKQNE